MKLVFDFFFHPKSISTERMYLKDLVFLNLNSDDFSSNSFTFVNFIFISY